MVVNLNCLLLLRVQGLPEWICDRLPCWQIDTNGMLVAAGEHLPHPDHPTALADVLRQLRDLQAHRPVCVALDEWDWSVESLHALAREGPSLTQLSYKFSLAISHVTDELLGGLLQCGEAVKRLVVGSLQLQSDQHANTPWPWEHLVLKTSAAMTQMLRLPDPARAARRPHVSGQLQLHRSDDPDQVESSCVTIHMLLTLFPGSC